MKMEFKNLSLGIYIVSLLMIATACESDDPVKEDAPELITKVTLTFTPTGGTPVVVTATDPDGEGVQDLEADGTVVLDPNVAYTLSIGLVNGLVSPGDDGYDIGEEVEAEGDEHMFFFGWNGAIFSDPSGNGNVDSRSDEVNYADEDANGLPLGLATQWTTAGAAGSGELRIVLKHQPDNLKSATSSSADGESDIDVTFDVSVE